MRAFSSEADAGSRQENASKQEFLSDVSIQSKREKFWVTITNIDYVNSPRMML
jgi:hypothetical protein